MSCEWNRWKKRRSGGDPVPSVPVCVWCGVVVKGTVARAGGAFLRTLLHCTPTYTDKVPLTVA